MILRLWIRSVPVLWQCHRHFVMLPDTISFIVYPARTILDPRCHRAVRTSCLNALWILWGLRCSKMDRFKPSLHPFTVPKLSLHCSCCIFVNTTLDFGGDGVAARLYVLTVKSHRLLRLCVVKLERPDLCKALIFLRVCLFVFVR